MHSIMHHIHKIKESDNLTSCKLLDDLIHVRLFREDKDVWIEKAVITRIWISCSTAASDVALEQLPGFLDSMAQNMKGPFSAHATHATQTVKAFLEIYHALANSLHSYCGSK